MSFPSPINCSCDCSPAPACGLRYQIEGEEKEKGGGFHIIGTKTDQSLRRVPSPAAVLPHLPKKISGPLFPRDAKDPADAASKRLGRFLRGGCGHARKG